MLARKITAFLMLTAVILCLGWAGCSDDTIQTIISESDLNNNSNSEVAIYFPLNEGYTTIYNITQSNGLSQTATFRVGSTADINGAEVIEWIGTSGGVVDTGYFRVTDDALYFYENRNSSAETILELPLSLGASWDRFGGDDIVLDDDLEDDNVEPADGDGEEADNENEGKGGDISNKTFPSFGSLSISVESIEQLELENGEYYSHTIKLSNTDASGLKTNYYWYAANVGLVKYVIGVTDNHPDGDIVGEIIDYGN